MTDNLPFIFEYFMTYNMPSSAKKHRENKLESRQMAKMFFILLLLQLVVQAGHRRTVSDTIFKSLSNEIIIFKVAELEIWLSE